MVASTLEEKLEQPHLRDLARNPMQLAILLHLIHVQGAALPEKRTTLYEEYMKLFFNREAEKSAVVRDHRDLLLSIHGVLAWVLQTQAEKGSGSGSITKDELRTQVKHFLATEEYNPNLADTLLAGTYERVGALVSRVEGTFEFEVQPLREYFAARHLYKTSPYSPPGRPRSGTRPDRFDALARSFYWTNVTRFFCGFYDVGELGTLVDGLFEIGIQNGYRLINQPRRLAIMLLSDQVFTQSPRMTKRLIGYITREEGFRRLIARATPRRLHGMRLPETAGRDILFKFCATKLNDETDSGQRRALRQVMASNAEENELKSLWIQRYENGLMTCDPLLEAFDFGVIRQFVPKEIEMLTKDDIELRLRWFAWLGHNDVITQDSNLYDAARSAFFSGAMTFHVRGPFHRGPIIYLELLSELLNIRTLADLFSASPDQVPAYALLDHGFAVGSMNLIPETQCEDESGNYDPLACFTQWVVNHLKTNVVDWKTRLCPWSTLVDKGIEVVPDSLIFARIAAVSTATTADQNLGIWDDDGFASTKGLVNRLYFARHKADDAAWWQLQLNAATGNSTVLCLSVLLSWGVPDVLTELESVINLIVDQLDAKDWSRLWLLLDCIATAANSRRPGFPESWFDDVGMLSSRVALALILRVEYSAAQTRLSRRMFRDYCGTDRHILQHAAAYEFTDADPREVDWNFVSHLSKLAGKSGLSLLMPMHRLDRGIVPENIALNILSDCESHCDQMVAICERSYGTRVAENAAKVSEVAERDDWFAPHPA